MSSIDVIIPCYRYARFLRQAVTSVLSETGTSVRVLIVDDASPDETPEVSKQLVSEDSRVHYVRHTVNKGHIATYNEGIDWISATYYLLLSADDYLLPGALQRAVDLMDTQAEVGFVFGNAVQIDEASGIQPVKPFPHGVPGTRGVMSGLDFIQASSAWNIVPTPTAVVRTTLQKQCGGYRAHLPHSGDMEMWLRLAARGRVGFVQADQAVYRRHSTNMSATYATSSWFPDVRQRREALDCFFSESGHLLPDIESIRRETYNALGRETMSLAGAAFDNSDLELSEQLAGYALAMSPAVRLSMPWCKLVVRRLVGRRIWRAVQGSDRAVRQAAS